MTEVQKKRLVDAFQTLSAAAQRGKRIAETGTLDDVAAHVADMSAIVDGLHEACVHAAGATAVLARTARAKPLSRSRPGSTTGQ